MKLRALLIIALFALGCTGAFAINYGPFAYLDSSKTFYYCETGSYTVSGSLAVGQKNLSGCGDSFNAVWVGFKATLPASSGQPVTGAILELADNEFDAGEDAYSGCQADFVTKTKASTKKLGWAFYYTCDGLSDSLSSYGYLISDADAAQSSQAHTATSMVGMKK